MYFCIIKSTFKNNENWCGNYISLFSLGSVTIPISKNILEPVICWPYCPLSYFSQQFSLLWPLLSQVKIEVCFGAVTDESRSTACLNNVCAGAGPPPSTLVTLLANSSPSKGHFSWSSNTRVSWVTCWWCWFWFVCSENLTSHSPGDWDSPELRQLYLHTGCSPGLVQLPASLIGRNTKVGGRFLPFF